jgi:tetratricopeptide (TPR) repeat protein
MAAGTELCGPESLQALVADISVADNSAALRRLAQAVERWPQDPRIHFLYASCLAEDRRYDDAAAAFEQAVSLQPDYAIARFQLGLLHLTSGRVSQALAVWAPLDGLAEQDPLRLFKQGLAALIEERWQDCVALLHRGIDANSAFPPLNRDMRLVIERASGAGADPVAPAADSAPSQPDVDPARHVLLSEYLTSKTKH